MGAWVPGALLTAVLLLSGCGGKEADTGPLTGGVGDTLQTAFFACTVDEVRLVDGIEDCGARSGCMLLAAEITVENTTEETVPMWDTDFLLQWEDGAETVPPLSGTNVTKQLPARYDLAAGESRSGLLVYEVPEDSRTFSISYQEYFDDGTTGACYVISFSAQQAEA